MSGQMSGSAHKHRMQTFVNRILQQILKTLSFNKIRKPPIELPLHLSQANPARMSDKAIQLPENDLAAKLF